MGMESAYVKPRLAYAVAAPPVPPKGGSVRAGSPGPARGSLAATQKPASPPPKAESPGPAKAKAKAKSPSPAKAKAKAKSKEGPAVPKPGTPFPKPGPLNDPFQDWPQSEIERFRRDLDRRIENVTPRRVRDACPETGDTGYETTEQARERAQIDAQRALATGYFPLDGRERRRAIRYLHYRLRDEPTYDETIHIDPNLYEYQSILAEMPDDWQPSTSSKGE